MSLSTRELNCFVIGLIDIKDTTFLLTQGKEVFIKANCLHAMNSSADMNLLEDIIGSNFGLNSYSDVHEFCTEFLLAEAQGKMNNKIFERLRDET
ncbi:hypothetical protein [Aliarcobacter butzleri]|uniref:hypothetical protein n=1 Tax=Aliarcobacter butzleri TaxID=28197 RepID=UPI00125FA832|nr:hypothetical protein [Aliarcobacter butzleri]MCG3690109.1 hypothetical protein [Aliarcobacter butzleri]MCT7596403.1 hypothetical protein [Aliarcobacter butzleri]